MESSHSAYFSVAKTTPGKPQNDYFWCSNEFSSILKRLYVFSIKSFAGPFVVTFCISMFMLIMQFFWKYIDDLMGKGIEVSVILELLLYVSASLIPLALPLAMLLSSIMTFGNLAEHNELTALKASGLSLYRIMRPLTMVVICICFGTFYFANYVIPVSTLKWRALIFDIQETKISALLTPGTYSNALDGYSIKIDQGSEHEFKGIVIHDHTNNNIIKTVKAEKGEIFKSGNGSFLFFKLVNGQSSEELAVINEAGSSTGGHFHPSRRSSFDNATYKIDLSGFKMNHSDEDLFKDEHEMMNVFQINRAVDSVQKQTRVIQRNFLEAMRNEHAYFQSARYKPGNPQTHALLKKDTVPEEIIQLSDLTKNEKLTAYSFAISRIRRIKPNLQGQKDFIVSIENNLAKYDIEFHRKLALTVTILVLFFVGAPLGAIVKKGGFGAPVVIAALLFMVYFVLISVGDNLASSGVLSPFMSMWMPTFILSPVAILLMRAAANDSRVFDKESWSKLFKRKRK